MLQLSHVKAEAATHQVLEVVSCSVMSAYGDVCRCSASRSRYY